MRILKVIFSPDMASCRCDFRHPGPSLARGRKRFAHGSGRPAHRRTCTAVHDSSRSSWRPRKLSHLRHLQRAAGVLPRCADAPARCPRLKVLTPLCCGAAAAGRRLCHVSAAAAAGGSSCVLVVCWWHTGGWPRWPRTCLAGRPSGPRRRPWPPGNQWCHRALLTRS